MTWFANSGNQTAAEAAHSEIVTFVDLDFPTGFVRLHTSTGTISVGGYDYLGVGKFGGISEVREDATMRPSGMTLSLSGVDSALITSAMTEKCHGRNVVVYTGWRHLETMALIATPETVFRGLIDSLECELGQNSGSITVQCEDEFARWERHQGSLYTDESQQTIYPGDRFFDQVQNMQFRVIDWSKTNVMSPYGEFSLAIARGRSRAPGG